MLDDEMFNSELDKVKEQNIDENNVNEESQNLEGSSGSTLEDVIEKDKDGWIDILGSGSLKKKVLVEGITASRPTKGNTVKISYVGRLEDGTEVDKVDELVYTLGDSEVIPGFDMIPPLMNKSEKADVYFEARFAYGDRGLDEKIPPKSNMFYTIELIDFKPEDEPDSLSVEERREVGNRKRERGNWWYNREDFQNAIQCYKSAVDFLDDTSDTHGEVASDDILQLFEDRFKTLNNMAFSQMKLEAYDVALKTLDTILQCQPNNVKALFRKGKILGIKGKALEGVECLKRALDQDPSDMKLIQQELSKLQQKARKEKEAERSLYRKMLGVKPGQKTETIPEPGRKPKITATIFKTIGFFFVLISICLYIYQYRQTISDQFLL